MPFYRFENLASHRFNPHLSTAEGPVIEGEFMYFRMVTKRAGTGSELHYHPNELMAFPLAGKINCMVGRDRRIVPPGTFVHIPPFARHGFKACEDGDLRYLYIKDRTWTLIGAAADEALPDKALSAGEVTKAVNAGRYPGQAKDASKSSAILDGLGTCYYPMIEALDAPAASGHCERWVEGTNIGFGFVESPPGYVTEALSAPHEQFLYVVRGTLDVKVGKEKRRANSGDVVHIPKSEPYHFKVAGGESARYAAVRSTPRLEREISQKGAADNWRG
ncbi:MAG TPA: cupin domain-containing protein [Burkholderiales bacterium]|nr:cupin domain-containing protein [Burkholderiales bacterium]